MDLFSEPEAPRVFEPTAFHILLGRLIWRAFKSANTECVIFHVIVSNPTPSHPPGCYRRERDGVALSAVFGTSIFTAVMTEGI